MDRVHRIKVLLVEDDEDSRELLAEILRSDFDILTADDGAVGLELFGRELPDIVLTDESIPGMRGTHLAREIKLRRPETRVVLVSGYGTVPGAEHCDLVLKKPLDVDRLLSALRNFFPEPTAVPMPEM
jgi:DNA-binding NtrC family response regulator